jgi:hypothetical protein
MGKSSLASSDVNQLLDYVNYLQSKGVDRRSLSGIVGSAVILGTCAFAKRDVPYADRIVEHMADVYAPLAKAKDLIQEGAHAPELTEDFIRQSIDAYVQLRSTPQTRDGGLVRQVRAILGEKGSAYNEVRVVGEKVIGSLTTARFRYDVRAAALRDFHRTQEALK